jgi:phage terminase large subunit
LERDKLARVDPDRYSWIWLGKFRKRSDVKVFNGKWKVEEFEAAQNWDGPYFGADFGFAADPSTLNKCWIANGNLYIEYEANGQHVELDDMPAFYDKIPGAREYLIKADCARPETISHIKSRGFRIEGADKWQGSVEDGITFLRSFEKIIIHPRCKHTIFEANAYEYKTDRLTGAILPDIVDKHNHHWDAIRYALDKMIKRRGKSWYDY